MGRASRPKGEQGTGFDPLRELREEGLLPGWRSYWQGERGEISPESASKQRDLKRAPDIAPEERELAEIVIGEFLRQRPHQALTNMRPSASLIIDEEASKEAFSEYKKWVAALDPEVRQAVFHALRRLGEAHLAVLWTKYVKGDKKVLKQSFAGVSFQGDISDAQVIQKLEKDAPSLELGKDADGNWVLRR